MKRQTRDALNYISKALTGVSSKWQKWQKKPEFAVYNENTKKFEIPSPELMLKAMEAAYERTVLSTLRSKEPADYTFCMAAFLTIEERNRYSMLFKKYSSDDSVADIFAELSPAVQEIITKNTIEEQDDEKDISDVVAYDYNEFVSLCHFCTKEPEKATEKLNEIIEQGEKIYASRRM